MNGYVMVAASMRDGSGMPKSWKFFSNSSNLAAELYLLTKRNNVSSAPSTAMGKEERVDLLQVLEGRGGMGHDASSGFFFFGGVLKLQSQETISCRFLFPLPSAGCVGRHSWGS